MGRKPKDPSQKSSGNKNYFTEVEEKAIILYNNETNSDVKNDIFTRQLYKPLEKLVMFVSKRYTTGPKLGEDGWDEMITDAFSHVYEQIHKFNPNKPNKLGEFPKAYSYLGTVCRHFVTNYGKKIWNKKLKHDNIEDYKIDFDEYDKNNKEKYIALIDEYDENPHFNLHETILIEMTDKIKSTINIETSLTKNQIKVGNGLILLFDGWKDIYQDTDMTNMTKFFAKKKLFQMLKDVTCLESKDVKEAFPMYQNMYTELCNNIFKRVQ
jgi:hypothetical protein